MVGEGRNNPIVYCYVELAVCLFPQPCGLTGDPKAECKKQDYKQ